MVGYVVRATWIGRLLQTSSIGEKDVSIQQKSISPRLIIQLLLFIVVIPFLPLLISWNWKWWEAWVYAILCILGFAVSRLLAGRRHPDLLSERAHFMRHEDALASWALIENRYFSGMVRIQTDRGHRVVSSGPYRWIRHPGYAGALLTYLATPLFLDAVTAFLPAAILLVLLVIRTYLEDKTLQERLAGYNEYVEGVPYRLLPGVW